MEAFWSVWWVWLSASIVFAIIEILVPGFLFLGFAIGAAIVSALLGMGMTVTLPVLLLIFAALSLVAWLGLRQFFAAPKGQVKTFDYDIND